jgi:hypothetical protein
MITPMPTKRERIDVMIDAHAWIRRHAGIHREWGSELEAITSAGDPLPASFGGQEGSTNFDCSRLAPCLLALTRDEC